MFSTQPALVFEITVITFHSRLIGPRGAQYRDLQIFTTKEVFRRRGETSASRLRMSHCASLKTSMVIGVPKLVSFATTQFIHASDFPKETAEVSSALDVEQII